MTILATIGQFATELRVSRDVLRRVLSEAGVAPAEVRSGRPRYALKDVYRALREQGSGTNPHDVVAVLKAEKLRDELRVSRGQLVLADEVRRGWIELVKRLVAWVESLADQLERAAGLTPKQVEQLERRIDEMRADLHVELTQKEGKRNGT